MSLSFSYNDFATHLDAASGIHLDTSQGNHGWDYKDSESSTNNLVLEYYYQLNDDDDKTNYRTWHHETSLLPHAGGLLVSTKIDHIRGADLDDHIILICGFNAAAELLLAQASVQITDNSKYNLTVPPQTLAMAGNDPGAIDNLVYNLIKATDFHDTGRNTIAQLVKDSIVAIRQSVTTK